VREKQRATHQINRRKIDNSRLENGGHHGTQAQALGLKGEDRKRPGGGKSKNHSARGESDQSEKLSISTRINKLMVTILGKIALSLKRMP